MSIELYIAFYIIIIIFVLLFWVYCKITVGICKCSKHLVRKVVVVTGASNGIGFETAKDLAARGARVIIADVDKKRGLNAKDEIIATTANNEVYYYYLNLASFKSIRSFATKLLKNENYLDILIHNAGVFGSENVKTEDGLLLGMQINYFGPFLLTNLLLPLLKLSSPSRIINVSSMAYYFGTIDLQNLNMEKDTTKKFKRRNVYANSKLCIINITQELGRRLQNTGVTANCLHPGCAVTHMSRNSDIAVISYLQFVFKLFWKTNWEAAQTSIYLAVSPEVTNVNGKYFRDCCVAKAITKQSTDAELGKKLWMLTEKLVGL